MGMTGYDYNDGGIVHKEKNAEGSFSGISCDGDSVILHIG
jgi:hypothetical protein